MASELKPCGGCGATSDRERCIGCLHDFGTPESAWVRPTPVAPVSPDATNAAQTFDQIVSYVLRYGGTCRDCADVDGICPNTDMPCGFELKTAVIKHTLKALEYGLSHGFIENPFSLPAPDATGKCGKLVTEFRTLSGEFVTRSQAEELLAAERAKKEMLAESLHIQIKRVNELEADNAALTAQLERFRSDRAYTVGFTDGHAAAEADNAALTARVKELEKRLRISESCNHFADNLSKEMRVLEAKLTAKNARIAELERGAYQEAYNAGYHARIIDTDRQGVIADVEAKLEAKDAEISAIAGHLDCEADSDSILHTIREIEADKEIYKERAEAIEAKLAAAEKALEPFAAVLEDYDPDWEDDDVSAVLVVGSVTHYGVTLGDFRKARAALGGQSNG